MLFRSVVFWVGLFLGFPKIPVVTTRRPQYWASYIIFRELESSIGRLADERREQASKLGDGSGEFSADWLRQQLKTNSEFRKNLDSRFQTNSFTGLPWKEEDSPGNYIVRQETNDVVAVYYEAHGEEKEFFRLSDWPARHLEGKEHRKR